jgi:hypothetical protein
MLGDEVDTQSTPIEVGALCPVCRGGTIDEDLQCQNCDTEFCAHCGGLIRSQMRAKGFRKCQCDEDEGDEEKELA